MGVRDRIAEWGFDKAGRLMAPSGLRVIFQRQTRKSPRREAERTMAYVSIHDGGFDAVSREIAPSAKPPENSGGLEPRVSHDAVWCHL